MKWTNSRSNDTIGSWRCILDGRILLLLTVVFLALGSSKSLFVSSETESFPVVSPDPQLGVDTGGQGLPLTPSEHEDEEESRPKWTPSHPRSILSADDTEYHEDVAGQQSLDYSDNYLGSLAACPYLKRAGKPVFNYDPYRKHPLPRLIQPPSCDMEKLVGSFFSRVLHTGGAARTIWFVGDSLLREVEMVFRCLAFRELGEGQKKSSVDTSKAKPVLRHTCTHFYVPLSKTLLLSLCQMKVFKFYSTPFLRECATPLACLKRGLLGPQDVVVSSFGAGYTSSALAHTLASDANLFAKEVVEIRKLHPKVKWLWLETSAEHYNRPGEEGQAEESCRELRGEDAELARWRLEATNPALQNLGEDLQIIPFWEVTSRAPLSHHLGVNGSGSKSVIFSGSSSEVDCTHWWLDGVPTIAAKLIMRGVVFGSSDNECGTTGALWEGEEGGSSPSTPSTPPPNVPPSSPPPTVSPSTSSPPSSLALSGSASNSTANSGSRDVTLDEIATRLWPTRAKESASESALDGWQSSPSADMQRIHQCPYVIGFKKRGPFRYFAQNRNHSLPSVMFRDGCEDYRELDDVFKRVTGSSSTTIWFLGDSLLKEMYIAMLCLLHRVWGMGTETRFAKHLPVINHECVRFPLPNSTSTLQLCFVKVFPFYSSHQFACGNSIQCLLTRRMLGPNDKVVVNFGVWYQPETDKERLEQDTKMFIEQVRSSRKQLPKVPWVWVETTAQHFPTYAGQYQKDLVIKKCRTLSKKFPEYRMANWRNKITSPPLIKAGNSLIKVISLWETTANAPLQHHAGWTVQSPKPFLDCTHWWVDGVPTIAANLILQTVVTGHPRCSQGVVWQT